jgi:hypothetical protein
MSYFLIKLSQYVNLKIIKDLMMINRNLMVYISCGNEIVIFGIFVKRMSKSGQWHVECSIPSNSLAFWSEKHLMGSKSSSFWGES